MGQEMVNKKGVKAANNARIHVICLRARLSRLDELDSFWLPNEQR